LLRQAIALPQSNAISPLQSIAAVMQERGERYRERMAGVSERVIGHIESMDADEILARSSQVEKIDNVARRRHRGARRRRGQSKRAVRWTCCCARRTKGL